MSKRLDLVMNGKGGVGKSFFATHFVQDLRDKAVPHVAVDTDPENSTLKRFHSDSGFLDPEQPRALDNLFSLFNQHDLVVADCRAASTDLLLDYFREIDLGEVLKAIGAELTLIMPVNHEPDSIEQIRVISGELQRLASYVIVRNEAHSQQFSLYDGSKTRQRIINEFAGQEISMKRMPDWLVTALNAHTLTISRALVHPKIPLLDRQRLRNWQRHFATQIALADKLLLPQPTSTQTNLPLDV